jgi:hypothetical protein
LELRVGTGFDRGKVCAKKYGGLDENEELSELLQGRNSKVSSDSVPAEVPAELRGERVGKYMIPEACFEGEACSRGKLPPVGVVVKFLKEDLDAGFISGGKDEARSFCK